MPIYHYNCLTCKADLEFYHSIKEPLRTQCPECHNESLRTVIEGPPLVAVKGEIKTVGQLAEANTKKMGKELLQKTMEADGTTNKLESRNKAKELYKLGSLSSEKKNKYIETGKL